MEEVIVGGTRYVATKVAASRWGYHPDYVGQLCREKQVRCIKVGRGWFVDERALARHKRESHIRSTPLSEEVSFVRRKDTFAPHHQALIASLTQHIRPISEPNLPLFVNEDQETLPPLRPKHDQQDAQPSSVSVGQSERGRLEQERRGVTHAHNPRVSAAPVADLPPSMGSVASNLLGTVDNSSTVRGKVGRTVNNSQAQKYTWSFAVVVGAITTSVAGIGLVVAASSLVQVWDYVPSVGEVRTSFEWRW